MFQSASVGSGRRRGAAARFLVLFVTWLGASAPGTLWSQPPQPLVYSATVDALIHPVSAEFMVDTMQRADHIHGVTMERPGVSRLISMAIPHAA